MPRLLCCILVWVALTASAAAQGGELSWPQRAIRLVVPFPAGSSTDIVARIVAQRLAVGLGQQLVIENRAGASGNIGAEVVARAAPDGYTIGIATASTHAVAASLSAALPYDPLKDFAPIGMIGGQPYVLVVHPSLPVATVAELITLAKAKPGVLNYGSAGVASLAHLATALFAKKAGVELTHVPYKSSAQSMTDMITGRLDMQLATVAPSLPNIRSHQLRAVATSGIERVSVLSEVPTIAESGLAGYEAILWISLVAPAGTAPAIVARLNSELNGVLALPDLKEALEAQGLQPQPGSSEAVMERIVLDTEKWRTIVAQTGVRSE
jgi:tripartite-type tricarboxylate transporter receptor subunit TctC